MVKGTVISFCHPWHSVRLYRTHSFRLSLVSLPSSSLNPCGASLFVNSSSSSSCLSPDSSIMLPRLPSRRCKPDSRFAERGEDGKDTREGDDEEGAGRTVFRGVVGGVGCGSGDEEGDSGRGTEDAAAMVAMFVECVGEVVVEEANRARRSHDRLDSSQLLEIFQVWQVIQVHLLYMAVTVRLRSGGDD
jgi:hypothetical protein